MRGTGCGTRKRRRRVLGAGKQWPQARVPQSVSEPKSWRSLHLTDRLSTVTIAVT